MAYGIFAQFYDAFTENVEYEQRADYIRSLLSFEGINGGILLDLACGTGSLLTHFCEKGFDVIGVDNSPEMLTFARDKLYEKGLNALLLCQDMAEIDLYGTIDAAICTLDSLNHITDEERLFKVFERLSLFMNQGGIFVFDVNTPYKHREVLGNNAFIYESDGVFCAWRNEYDGKDTVKIFLDIFAENGGKYNRYTEEFSERAYSHEFISDIIEKTGFELVALYDELSDSAPNEFSERVYYVVKKK